MKKITVVFALLTSLVTAGTAFADRDNGRDHRGPQAPIVVQPAPVHVDARPQFAPGGQWDLLANKAAFGRRGTITMNVPRGQSYDQLRLVASDRGLDIVAVELTYARGRTEIVKPARDGMAAIDLGKGNLKQIKVRYLNRGAGRDASIKVLAKDEGRMTFNGR